jgi:hypothetical protein
MESYHTAGRQEDVKGAYQRLLASIDVAGRPMKLILPYGTTRDGGHHISGIVRRARLVAGRRV